MHPDVQLHYNIRLLGKPFTELDPRQELLPIRLIHGYEFEGVKYYEIDDKIIKREHMASDSTTESVIVLDSYWVGRVGFILAENVKTKKQTVRIGTSGPLCMNEADDVSHILDYGHSLYIHQAYGFFKDKIRPEDYVISSDGLQDWYEDGNK